MCNTSCFFRYAIFLLTLSLLCSVSSAATVAHWNLDDGLTDSSTLTAVDSAGGNDGTLSGFALPDSWIEGIIDGGLAFDGIDDVVDAGAGTQLDLTGSLTMTVWINWQGGNSDSTYGHVIGKNRYGGAADDSYYIKCETDGRITFGVTESGSNYELTGSTGINQDEWHHIAVVFEPGTAMTIYLDGEEYATDTTGIPAGTAVTTTPFTMGQIDGTSTGYAFNGYIDDVRVYDTAWGQTDVRNLISEFLPFTVVALPDTQFYCESYPDIFSSQTQWIADNTSSEAIEYVSHLGDIVQTGSDSTQWGVADNAMAKLDGLLPYGVVIGNHDFDDQGGDRGTTFRSYFGSSRFIGNPGYGGHSGDELNSWHTFQAGPWEFLMIHLDIDAPDAALQWAQSVVDNHPNMPTIVSTHVYMDQSSGREPAPYVRTSGNGGEQIWQEFIRQNDQIFMVLCGHWNGERLEVDQNLNSNPVYQILTDYQSRSNGGNGWLQMYKFKPLKNQIDVTTYSPWLNEYETDSDSQYTINVDFAQRFDFQPTATAVAHWTLDDGLDDPCAVMAADSIGTNDGTLEDYPADPNWVEGVLGGGLAFDGIDTDVDAGSGSDLDLTGALTMTAWINKQGPNGDSYGHLVGKNQTGGSAGDSYYLKSMNDDTLAFGVTPGNNFEIKGSSPVSLDQWHHVAAVFVPGESMRIYLDGELYLEETSGVPASTKIVSTPFTMGQIDTANTGYTFNGYIDDVKVFDGELAQEQIRQMAVEGITFAGHWPLDDGRDNPSSTTAADIERSNDGILEGFPTQPTWSEGIIGGALDFDGTDDVVVVPQTDVLDITGSLTMMVWINKQGANSNDRYGHLIGKNHTGGPSADSYYLKSEATDVLTFGVTSAGENTELTGTEPVPQNQWHQVTAVFVPGESMMLYLDGKEYATKVTNVPSSTAVTGTAFTMGQIDGRTTGYAFNGYLDDVRLYRKALTKSEIVDLYLISGLPYCESYLPGDINKDCYVNFIDIAAMSENWLNCNDAGNPNCQ